MFETLTAEELATLHRHTKDASWDLDSVYGEYAPISEEIYKLANEIAEAV